MITTTLSSNTRALLIILDGFGIGKDTPFNAIQNAKMPFYRTLIQKYPHSQLLTHGAAVGLPDGVMGNSEVGHMTMGAGRILYQDLTRISKAIADQTFITNPILQSTLKTGAKNTGRVHLMGLLSDGGVHSHIDHLIALIDLCIELQIPEVYVHAFLDGRDTPPHSSIGYLKTLLNHPGFSEDGARSTRVRIATVCGRYYAMDRDQRWERVAQAYATMTGQVSPQTPNAIEAVEKSHALGKSDEFVDPVLLLNEGAIREGDSAVFFNYRSDRAREISAAFTRQEFKGFPRGNAPKLSAFCGMTVYDATLAIPAAFEQQNLNHIFASWLEQHQLTQFRIAETEKYAHVTFFFNGGREKPFVGEERLLVPSPRDVETYDLKPEMSAFVVAEEAVKRLALKKDSFMLMNFANADMVGHTGNYAATVRAMEALDTCLEKVVGAAEKQGYHTLITADHGNAEEMCDSEGRLHTQHTLNPVPAIWVAPGSASAPKSYRRAMKDGGLQDIMPTLCDLMGLTLPQEVTGTSLIPAELKSR